MRTKNLITYINFARLLVERDRWLERTRRMADDRIEIRGLSDIVRDAKRAISDIREHSTGLRDDTRALKKTLVDVRTQVNAMHEDLKFEVTTLGNSPPPGEGLEKKPADGAAEPDSFRAAEGTH